MNSIGGIFERRYKRARIKIIQGKWREGDGESSKREIERHKKNNIYDA